MSRTYGDRADSTDKVRVLKRQVDSLKKEIARLRKDLNKANQRIVELQQPEEDSPKRASKTDELKCLDCGKGVYQSLSIPTRGGEVKTYLTCNLCGHRKVLK